MPKAIDVSKTSMAVDITTILMMFPLQKVISY